MDPDTALQLAAVIGLYREWRRSKECDREYGVHPMNARRKEVGQFHTTMAELKVDEERFKQYTRMSMQSFDKLVHLIEHRLEKRSAREPLSPEERLVVCLRFLSTGDSFHSIGVNFRIGVSTACSVCHEVCRVLVEEFASVYLRTPSTTDEWKEIADGFLGKWQLPNALGAIDGKHIRLKAPANSGSLYYNYKQYFSTLLIVVADHRSRIVYAHFGSYGRESDAGIFDRSDFRRLVSDPTNPLRLPDPEPLPGGHVDVPFFFIGDGAFPLQMHIMKPFSQRDLSEEKRIFNYGISRGRRVVESTFGIMAAKWRILLKPIETTVAKADVIVKAICTLHNFLIAQGEAGQNFTEEDLQYAEQLKEAPMRVPRANHAPHDAVNMREVLVDYFNGIGSHGSLHRQLPPQCHSRDSHSIWDPTEPQFHSVGARKYAFDGVADRLGLLRTLRDALYGNAAFEDIRRMWRQWVRSFYAYKTRETRRKPKFFAELSFLNELTTEQLSIVASVY